MTSEKQSAKRLRGFAAMSPEKRKQIASMGGRHAHALGKAHQFTKEEASAAGRKGGGAKKRGAHVGKE